MQDSSNPLSSSEETKPLDVTEQEQTEKEDRWSFIWESLVRWGLGETTIRVFTALFSIVLVLLVVWVMGRFFLEGQQVPSNEAVGGTPMPAMVMRADLPPMEIPKADLVFQNGIARKSMIRTSAIVKQRGEIQTYEVQKGDTIFGIAKKFGLQPETILWSNVNILGDNVDKLSPGQKLNILPVDGVYYDWHAGDGLNGVAEYFKVTPDDIINWPGNQLKIETLGDLSHPNIQPGTWLVVPGGKRDLITWSAPYITRTDPAVAKIFGAGFCGSITDGPVGTGSFIWPTIDKFLSGYDYTPPIHYGIDVAGQQGNAIYAVDSGVVVYAGWNDWGYGNVIVIDRSIISWADRAPTSTKTIPLGP